MREQLPPPSSKPCVICNRLGHAAHFCPGEPLREGEEPDLPPPVGVKFVIIKINVLREYLEHELYM
eukprot:Pgem_evm1s15788